MIYDPMCVRFVSAKSIRFVSKLNINVIINDRMIKLRREYAEHFIKLKKLNSKKYIISPLFPEGIGRVTVVHPHFNDTVIESEVIARSESNGFTTVGSYPKPVLLLTIS